MELLPILDYQFKEDCNTEKKIASKLKSFPERSLLQDEDKIRRELFDLVQVACYVKGFHNLYFKEIVIVFILIFGKYVTVFI